MRHSTYAVGLAALCLFACAKSSESQPIVSAPIGVSSPLDAAAPTPSASSAPAPSASDGAAPVSANGPDASDSAQFRSCQQDSDCVSVPRVGCCHNGYLEAVNASEKDAYQQSFTCPKRHPCPMFMIRDTRVPKCDTTSNLCVMVKPTTP